MQIEFTVVEALLWGSLSVCLVPKHEEGGRKMNSRTLPIELIREVLLRLPVRSLLRFKCVCKLWFSLISEPQFGISHYDLAAAPSHRILFRSKNFNFDSIDVNAPLKENPSVVHFQLPLPPPSQCCEFECSADFHNPYEILGSCRGLILLHHDRSYEFIVWNPSTGVYKRFPGFVYEITYEFLYGFVYDASRDDYLLILIDFACIDYDDDDFDDELCKGEVHISSFKTDSFVEFKDVNALYKDLGYGFRAGSLVNDALHWLVLSKDKNVTLILAFDLIPRSLSEIPLFDHSTMEIYEVYSLRVMRECLSVCCSVRGGEWAEIWVMKEYKVHSSWTKSIVIPTYDVPRNRFSPICITEDGEIFGSNITRRLEKINENGELLEYLGFGRGRRKLYKSNLQSAMYTESLLSLPTVSRKTRVDDYGETSEDDYGEISEDEDQETSEDDIGETSEDEEQ